MELLPQRSAIESQYDDIPPFVKFHSADILPVMTSAEYKAKFANLAGFPQTKDQLMFFEDRTAVFTCGHLQLPLPALSSVRNLLQAQAYNATGNIFNDMLRDPSLEKCSSPHFVPEDAAFSAEMHIKLGSIWTSALTSLANYLPTSGATHKSDADAYSRLGTGLIVDVLRMLSKLQPSMDTRGLSSNLERPDFKFSDVPPGRDVSGKPVPFQSQWKMLPMETQTLFGLHDFKRAVVDMPLQLQGLSKWSPQGTVPVAFDLIVVVDNVLLLVYYALLRCHPVRDSATNRVLGYKMELLQQGAIPLGNKHAFPLGELLSGVNVSVALGPLAALAEVGRFLALLAYVARETQRPFSVKVISDLPNVELLEAPSMTLTGSVSVSSEQLPETTKRLFAEAKKLALACNIKITGHKRGHGKRTRLYVDATYKTRSGIALLKLGVKDAAKRRLWNELHLVNKLAGCKHMLVGHDVRFMALSGSENGSYLVQWMRKMEMCDSMNETRQQQFVAQLPELLMELHHKQVAMVDVHETNFGFYNDVLMVSDLDSAREYASEDTIRAVAYHAEYAAPEVTRGDATVTLKADVYSFAKLLLKMCLAVLDEKAQGNLLLAASESPDQRPDMSAFISQLTAMATSAVLE